MNSLNNSNESSTSNLDSAERNWNQITSRIQNGEEASFEVYYQFVFDRVFREVKRLTQRDDQTSLDVVQETMVKIVRYIKPLPDEPAVVGWTLAVTKSVCYNWLRKSKRLTEQHLLWQSDHEKLAADETESWNVARLMWVEAQLLQLPAELQTMISLRYRVGWTLRQIAESLGLKTGLVDGRIRRAMKTLNEQAKQEFNE